MHWSTTRQPADSRTEIAKLERQVATLVDAIKSGGLRASPAVGQSLQEMESALSRLKACPARPSAEQLLPQLAARCRKSIDNIERTLMTVPRPAGNRRTRRADSGRDDPQEILLAATGTQVGGADVAPPPSVVPQIEPIRRQIWRANFCHSSWQKFRGDTTSRCSRNRITRLSVCATRSKPQQTAGRGPCSSTGSNLISAGKGGNQFQDRLAATSCRSRQRDRPLSV
jgi:hypothetical protein